MSMRAQTISTPMGRRFQSADREYPTAHRGVILFGCTSFPWYGVLGVLPPWLFCAAYWAPIGSRCPLTASGNYCGTEKQEPKTGTGGGGTRTALQECGTSRVRGKAQSGRAPRKYSGARSGNFKTPWALQRVHVHVLQLRASPLAWSVYFGGQDHRTVR